MSGRQRQGPRAPTSPPSHVHAAGREEGSSHTNTAKLNPPALRRAQYKLEAGGQVPASVTRM
eukprot:7378227-Prymnesium_polylepis.2